jgi:hypothetical protein
MNAPSYRPTPSPRLAAVPAPAGAPAAPAVRIGEDAFVSEAVLEGWLRSGEARRTGALLVTRDGRRFVLRDALRVVGRRNGDTDPYGLTGNAEPLRDLIRQGAIVSSDGIRLGAAVYDVEFGVLAVPAASPSSPPELS